MAVNLLPMFTPGARRDDSGGDDGGMRRQLAEALLMQSLKQGGGQPIQHWTQGAAQVMDSLTSALMYRKAMQDESGERKRNTNDITKLLQMEYGRNTPPSAPGSPPAAPMAPVAPVDPASIPNMGSIGDGQQPSEPVMFGASNLVPSEMARENLARTLTGGFFDRPGPDGIAPDQSGQNKTSNILSGMAPVAGPQLPVARDTMPPGVLDRSRYNIDPMTQRALLANVHAEVGDQFNKNPDVARAKLETIFNRAAARGLTLQQAATDPSYYPPVTLQRMQQTSDAALSPYGGVLKDVLGGSNVSNYATGNASGTVGFAGGPQTYQAPGTYERFGIEGPDRKWADRARTATGPLPPMQAPQAPEGIMPRPVTTQSMPAPSASDVPRPMLAQAGNGFVSPEEMAILGRLMNARDPAARAAGMQMMQQYQKRFGPLSQMDQAELDYKRAQVEVLKAKPQGQNMEVNGKIVRVDPSGNAKEIFNAGEKAPQGYRSTADGNMEAVPGGPADVKVNEKRQQDFASKNQLIQGLDELAKSVNRVKSHPGLKSNYGLTGVIPNRPGSQASDAAALLETLRTQGAFATLQDMRNASKTGGALGAVSDAEQRMLQSAIAPLQKSQSYEQTTQSLQTILDHIEASKQRITDAYNDHWNRGGAAAKQPMANTPPADGVARPRSKEEFDRLPRGTRFIAPDGSPRIKP